MILLLPLLGLNIGNWVIYVTAGGCLFSFMCLWFFKERSHRSEEDQRDITHRQPQSLSQP